METRFDLKEEFKKSRFTVVEVSVWEWFDKTYGNSYFNAVVKIVMGAETIRQYMIPFEYGYGDHAFWVASETLGFHGSGMTLIDFCREYDIYLSHTKKENCLRRDLRNREKWFEEIPKQEGARA